MKLAHFYPGWITVVTCAARSDQNLSSAKLLTNQIIHVYRTPNTDSYNITSVNSYWSMCWCPVNKTNITTYLYKNGKQILALFGLSPAGTSFQVVMSRGCDWLRTGPTSDAQVSPLLQASAPTRERHIQEAEYCLPKSMGISPGPTWITTIEISS